MRGRLPRYVTFVIPVRKLAILRTTNMTSADANLTDRSLPKPASNPDADVVIFDGNCRFCTSQVKRLARWDRCKRLAFLSLHDAEVRRLFPDLTNDDLMKQMYVIDKEGNRYAGAA